MDTIVQGEEKNELTSKIIPGMENMDWGGGFFTRQVSGLACLTEVLRATGRKTDYVEVMGLSGAAFKLTLNPGICPSGAVAEVGYNCFSQGLSMFGLSADVINLNPEENPGGLEQARKAIVESIDRGIPAIYADGEASLVVGYRDGGKKFICKVYAGEAPGYTEMTELKGMLGDAWSVYILRFDPGGKSLRDRVIASLRRAVTLAKTESYPWDDRGPTYGGFAGYKAWVRDLEDTAKEDLNPHGNAYNYAILATSRAAASEYLTRISDDFDEEISEQLRAAAARYDRIADRMQEGKECAEFPWDKSFTPENRALEATIMKENLDDEHAAIAEIQRTLESLA